MIKRKTKNSSLRPEVDDGDILKIVGCKMFSRKFGKEKKDKRIFSDSVGVNSYPYNLQIGFEIRGLKFRVAKKFKLSADR